MKNGETAHVVAGAGGLRSAPGSANVSPLVSTVRLPSRPGSPARLRSRASVAVSNFEVHSDSIERLEEDLALINERLDEEGEDVGRSKEVQLPLPRPVLSTTFADEPLITAGISDYTFIPLEAGGLLGRGKFSSVQLAWKNGQKFAVKITPLYPHHTLIATRLLREPTILAQLPLHPNLVRVYESIRTPGYFYLVEEFLDGYTNLESFVAAQPGQKLTLPQATHVLNQLVSVVRSALHQPIQIAHRDIKPENILIHPETLHITLLDFGLATHFSWRQPKLTTCCGSPAFHAPELFLSLKSPPGSVRYWGPEIDIWTIGITLLRCLTGHKYPLGVSHTSLQHMADKTIDSLLSVEHKDFRRTLAGLLDMDGNKRIEFFKALPSEIDSYPYNDPQHISIEEREFKNTSFIEAEPKHVLPLPLLSPALAASINAPNGTNGFFSSRSRSQSRDRLAAHFAAGLDISQDSQPSTSTSPPPLPAVSELLLLNPTGEPALRIISFVKYALRCAGILYHVQASRASSAEDLPSVEAPKMHPCSPVLHCIQVLPKEQRNPSAAAHLLTQLRPPLTRAQTAGPRSPSAPPAGKGQLAKKTEAPKFRCLEFWIQIIPIFSHARSSPKTDRRKRRPKSRSRQEEKKCTKLRIRVSDEQALEYLKKALSVGKLDEEDEEKVEITATSAGAGEEEDSRGRPKLSRSVSSSGSHGHSQSPSRPRMSRAFTEAPPIISTPAPAEVADATSQARPKRGFFDLVGFGKRSASVGPWSAATSPAALETPGLGQPETPNVFAFAAL